MMINELPRNTMDIATTYFEDPKIQSQFKKDMDNNMKILSGVDPVVSNEELSNQINIDNNALLDNGTADAMLVRNDRESLELLTQNMEIMGAMARTNPKISAADYYTQTEMANKAAIDDVYRINLTNSKDDPRIYSTKSMIGFEKISEALDGLKPNYVRNTVRFLGQPALSIGLAVATKGKAAPFTDAIMAGWDSSILGDTIYNVQENYNQRYYDILNNPSLTLEQFEEEMGNLVKDIQIKVAPEYQFEVLNSLVEGPNPFADAGLSFTSLGIKNTAMSVGFLAKMARKALPFKQGMSLKRMQMNQDLTEKIKKSITNSVDESVVDDNIASEVATIAPKDTKQEDVDVVKGLMKNEINDEKLLSNNNNDFSYFDRILRGLSGADEKTGSNQRGEIKLKRPEQSYFIDHGKGVDGDQPLTYEEAFELLRKIQGRGNRAYPWKHSNAASLLWDPDIEPEYIAIQSASRGSWSKNKNIPGVWDYEGHQSSGAGDEWFLGGGYASEQASPWVAAKGYYYKEFSPDIFDFRDYVQQSIINDADTLKYAISKYDPNGKYYRRAFKIYDKDRDKALQKWKEDLSSAYALESWMNRQGISENEVDVLLKIEKNLFGFNSHIDNTRRIALTETSDAALKAASILSGDAKGKVEDILKDAEAILKDEDKIIKRTVVDFIDEYKKFIEIESESLPFKKNEEEIFDYYRSIVDEQNSNNIVKYDHITHPSTPGEKQFSTLIQLYDNILDRTLDSEGLKNLIQMFEHPEKYSPPSAHLQTLGIRNPMKNPEGVLYFDSNRGLIPFSSLFSGVRYDFKNPSKYKEYMKKLRDIQKRDLIRINKVKKDIIDGFLKKIDQMEGDEPLVLWEGLPDDPEPWASFSKDMDRTEALKSFKRYLEENNSFNHLGRFRDLLKEFVKPFSNIEAKNYNAWERAYLHEKGLRHTWHNGGGSASFNVSIQDFDDVTPVTLDVTGIGTPWQTVIAYDNAHFLVKAGDGVGYFVRELHGVKGAKPMIIKSGKGIDKNDFILDMGDYKPYNK